MTSAKVDKDKCIKCRKCVDICFLNVIVWDEEEDAPFLKYGYDCQVCSECEDLCPCGALLIVPDWKEKHQPRLLAGNYGGDR